jgi:calcium-activated chloride channel regulator 3/4
MRRCNDRYLDLLIVCLLIALTSSTAFAGRHWLSGRETKNENGGLQKIGPVPTTSSPGVFDVVVSLHKNPTGDNDPSTVDDRTPYEEILGYFADAVYEATEGAHKIGKVSIYVDNKFSNKADIVWQEKGWPQSSVAGYENSGHIYMWDLFGGGCGCINEVLGVCVKECDLDFIANDKIGGGYTIAHEWGHYAMGLYDEYIGTNPLYNILPSMPHTDDDDVSPSIMNSQWKAEGGNYDWLNFSIAYQDPLGQDFRNTKKTAQHRMYGSSGWETLVRDPKNDPKYLWIISKQNRTYFPEFSSVAPQNEPIIQLPNSSARSEFKVEWMTDKLTYVMVIDNSGSMDGNKIANARTAAKYLIDVAEVNKTAIGVVAIDCSPSVVSQIIDVTSDADKNALKSAIDGLNASAGCTAEYDAAMTAFNSLTQRPDTETKIAFLLTDGLDNSSSATEDSVISSYKSKQIPLFTFAYGSDADQITLQGMATETGGSFYFSPTTLPEITQAFNDANKEVAPSKGIANSQSTVQPAATQVMDFPVDSTVSKLSMFVSFSGALGDLTLSLKDPDGNTLSNIFTCSQSGTETLCIYSEPLPKVGLWQLIAVSQTASVLNISYSIDGWSDTKIEYSLSVSNLTGTLVQYPAPILLLASFAKEAPIAGAIISGTIEFPDGTIKNLNFRDDGVAPDDKAGDGNYSAIFTDYTMDGVYNVRVSVDNSQNTANMTVSGLQPSVAEDGSMPPMPPDVPLNENVARTYTFQLTVQGVVSDDHGNDFSTATAITADNSDHPGIIETLGDIDFFKVTVPDTSVSEVVFRITRLSPEMIPVLSVYDSSYNLLKEKTYAVGGSYISISVKPNGSNTFYTSVKYSGNTGTGSYYMSTGTGVASDKLSKTAPSNLISKPTSATSIVLSWKDNSDNETGFKIERKDGDCASADSWSQIATKAANIITHTDIGLIPNTAYAYRIWAYNADGDSNYSNCASTKTRLEGTPNAPTGLKAISASASKINLTWTDNSTDEKIFKIYRRLNSGSFIWLHTKAANKAGYSDTTAYGSNLTNSYSYYIRACNAAGCSAATSTAVVPLKPTSIATSAVSSTQINLSWTDNSSNETGFQVYRKAGDCASTNSWTLINTTGANVTSFNNTGLTSGQTYSYKLRSFTKSTSAPSAYGYSLYTGCSNKTTP